MGEISDRANGKAKQLKGRVSHDPMLRAEGVIDEVKGNLKGALHKLANATRNIAALARETVKGDKKSMK